MPPKKKFKAPADISVEAASADNVASGPPSAKDIAAAANAFNLISTGEPVISDGWTDEQEAQLYKGISLERLKPAGIHKHFHVMCLSQMLRNNNNGIAEEHTSPEGIWTKLRSLYYLEGCDEREDMDSQFDEGNFREFRLPEDDFAEMMSARRLNPQGTESPASKKRRRMSIVSNSTKLDRTGGPGPSSLADKTVRSSADKTVRSSTPEPAEGHSANLGPETKRSTPALEARTTPAPAVTDVRTVKTSRRGIRGHSRASRASLRASRRGGRYGSRRLTSSVDVDEATISDGIDEDAQISPDPRDIGEGLGGSIVEDDGNKGEAGQGQDDNDVDMSGLDGVPRNNGNKNDMKSLNSRNSASSSNSEGNSVEAESAPDNDGDDQSEKTSGDGEDGDETQDDHEGDDGDEVPNSEDEGTAETEEGQDPAPKTPARRARAGGPRSVRGTLRKVPNTDVRRSTRKK